MKTLRQISEYARMVVRARKELPVAELLPFLRLRRWRSGARTKTMQGRLHAFHPNKLNGETIWIREGTSDIATLEDLVFHGYYLPPIPLDKCAVILDLGANIGCSAAHLASLYPSARIVAVELEPANANLASRNLSAFGDRVCVVQAAIWSHDGEVGYGGASQDAFRAMPNSAGNGSVRAISIATLLREHGISAIDYLKIDIEGAEKELLCDGDCSWLDHVHCVKVEVHRDSLFVPIFEVFEAHGFTVVKDAAHWSCITAWRGS